MGRIMILRRYDRRKIGKMHQQAKQSMVENEARHMNAQMFLKILVGIMGTTILMMMMSKWKKKNLKQKHVAAHHRKLE